MTDLDGAPEPTKAPEPTNAPEPTEAPESTKARIARVLTDQETDGSQDSGMLDSAVTHGEHSDERTADEPAVGSGVRPDQDRHWRCW